MQGSEIVRVPVRVDDEAEQVRTDVGVRTATPTRSGTPFPKTSIFVRYRRYREDVRSLQRVHASIIAWVRDVLLSSPCVPDDQAVW